MRNKRVMMVGHIRYICENCFDELCMDGKKAYQGLEIDYDACRNPDGSEPVCDECGREYALYETLIAEEIKEV